VGGGPFLHPPPRRRRRRLLMLLLLAMLLATLIQPRCLRRQKERPKGFTFMGAWAPEKREFPFQKKKKKSERVATGKKKRRL
jgi:hypothetical protein